MTNGRQSPLSDRVAVGIVLERRETDHPWQDHAWHALAVVPGGAPEQEWRVLGTGPGWTRYLAGSLDLELFPRETEGYRQNLAYPSPAVFVVLRPGEGEHEVEPFLVTACPYEAQDYMDSGEEIVESVAMPGDLAAWVRAYVERHPVDEPFIKRKQKSKTCGVTSEPFARPPRETRRGR